MEEYTAIIYFVVLYLIDIDECENSNNNDICEHFCKNTMGSFVCKCKPGYSKTANQVGCLGKHNIAYTKYLLDSRNTVGWFLIASIY